MSGLDVEQIGGKLYKQANGDYNTFGVAFHIIPKEQLCFAGL